MRPRRRPPLPHVVSIFQWHVGNNKFANGTLPWRRTGATAANGASQEAIFHWPRQREFSPQSLNVVPQVLFPCCNIHSTLCCNGCFQITLACWKGSDCRAIQCAWSGIEVGIGLRTAAGCLGMGSHAVFICGDGFIITFSVANALSQRPRPALFDPSSRASVLNFLPAANQWCTYGATAAETRVAPRLKKPFDSSPWVVPSL